MRVGFATLALLVAPHGAAAQEPIDFQWRAFGQFTAEHFDGSDDTLRFGAERLRPRLQLDAGRLTAAIQLDLAVDGLSDRRPGTLANVILDVFAGYRFEERHRVRFGQFKTPLGMDFNVPAHALDITKRGMEAGLVLNRDLGVMLTGDRVLGGLSYDVGVFNPAGRSQATSYLDSQVGEDTTRVGRLRYDNDAWHAELAHGEAEHADGPGSPDYAVSDLSVRYAARPWTFKAEWIQGRNVRGEAGRRERVYFVHAAYGLIPTLELVARYYRGRSRVDGVTTELGNAYVGITKHFAPERRFKTRLQVNYVDAGGDRAGYTGVRGFRDDAVFLQLQVYAEK